MTLQTNADFVSWNLLWTAVCSFAFVCVCVHVLFIDYVYKHSVYTIIPSIQRFSLASSFSVWPLANNEKVK